MMKNGDSSEDIVFRSRLEGSKSKGMLIGMICFAVLAIGGIGFGVWVMMDGNDKIAKKDEQINDLNSQLAEKEQTTEGDDEEEGGEGAEGSGASLSHPIVAAVPPKQYSLRYSFGVRSGNSGDPASLMIDVSEGKNLRCTASGDNTECSITGVPEGIYKIVDIYEGQGGLNDKIGFLMSDGSIWYVEPYDENNALVRNMEAKKANIDGFVKDVIRIEYGDENPTNYYVSTVFVMGDDSIVKYDESMFR